MKKIKNLLSNKGVISLNDTLYLNLIIILAPLVNFLSGISIDLYAPSLPAITLYFHTSTTAVQNTISTTLMGFAIGCILWGVLFDTLGRKKIIISALLVFIISSLLAPHCQSITQLMVLRFIQGMTTSAMSVGCRSTLADHLTGHRFIVAMMYASVAYGLGPVIGPFIGGYLQDHFGWQANFYMFAIFASIILILFLLFLEERFIKPENFTMLHAAIFYKTILTNKAFIVGAIVFGIIQLQLLIFPTVGPFLVEHQLHFSAAIYGNCALLAGAGYLSGVLINRSLLHLFSQTKLIHIGFGILGVALLSQLIFSLFVGLKLWSLVIPIVFFGISAGFIYGNILSKYLKIFPNNVGATTAILMFLLTLFAAIGVFIISFFKISSLFHLFLIFLVAIIVQTALYWYLYTRKLI